MDTKKHDVVKSEYYLDPTNPSKRTIHKEFFLIEDEITHKEEDRSLHRIDGPAAIHYFKNGKPIIEYYIIAGIIQKIIKYDYDGNIIEINNWI